MDAAADLYWWEVCGNLADLGSYLYEQEGWNLGEFADALNRPWRLDQEWQRFRRWQGEQQRKQLEGPD